MQAKMLTMVISGVGFVEIYLAILRMFKYCLCTVFVIREKTNVTAQETLHDLETFYLSDYLLLPTCQFMLQVTRNYIQLVSYLLALVDELFPLPEPQKTQTQKHTQFLFITSYSAELSPSPETLPLTSTLQSGRLGCSSSKISQHILLSYSQHCIVIIT